MSLRDDLKAYVDGELSADRAAEVSAALNADPDLAAEADEIRKLSGAIQAFSEVPSPVGLEKALRAIRPKPAWWSPAGRTGQLAWGTAAMAAAVVAVVFFLPNRSGMQSESARYVTASSLSAKASDSAASEKAMAASPPAKLSQPAPETFTAGAGSKAEAANGMVPAAADVAKTKQQPAESRERELKGQELRLNMKVADADQAEQEVLAVAGPLGGFAEADKNRVVLTVPQDRTEDALKELRRIGKVETLESAKSDAEHQSDPTLQGGVQDIGSLPVTNIEANLQSEPVAKPRADSDEPGPSPIFWGLLGLIGLAGAGVMWSLRRRV